MNTTLAGKAPERSTQGRTGTATTLPKKKVRTSQSPNGNSGPKDSLVLSGESSGSSPAAIYTRMQVVKAASGSADFDRQRSDYEGLSETAKGDFFDPSYNEGIEKAQLYANEAERKDTLTRAAAQRASGLLEQRKELWEESGKLEREISKARRDLEKAKRAEQETRAKKAPDDSRKYIDFFSKEFSQKGIQEDRKYYPPRRYPDNSIGRDPRRHGAIVDSATFHRNKWDYKVRTWRNELRVGKKTTEEVKAKMLAEIENSPRGPKDKELLRKYAEQFVSAGAAERKHSQGLNDAKKTTQRRKAKLAELTGDLKEIEEKKSTNAKELDETNLGHEKLVEWALEKKPVSAEESFRKRADFEIKSYSLSPELTDRKTVGGYGHKIVSQDIQGDTLALKYENGAEVTAQSSVESLTVRSSRDNQLRETVYARAEDGSKVSVGHQALEVDDKGDLKKHFVRVGTPNGARTEEKYERSDNGDESKEVLLVDSSGGQIKNKSSWRKDGSEKHTEEHKDSNGRVTGSSKRYLGRPEKFEDLDVDGLSVWLGAQPQHLADRLGERGTVRVGESIETRNGRTTSRDVEEYKSADGKRKLTLMTSEGAANHWVYEQADKDKYGTKTTKKQSFFQGTKDTILESIRVHADGDVSKESTNVMWESADAARKKGQIVPGLTQSEIDVLPGMSRSHLNIELEELNDKNLLTNPLLKKYLKENPGELTMTDSKGLMLFGGNEDSRGRITEEFDRDFRRSSKDFLETAEGKRDRLRRDGYTLRTQRTIALQSADGSILNLSQGETGRWEVTEPRVTRQLQDAKSGEHASIDAKKALALVKNKMTAPVKMRKLGLLARAGKDSLRTQALADGLKAIDDGKLARASNKASLGTGVLGLWNAGNSLAGAEFGQALRDVGGAGHDLATGVNAMSKSGNVVGRASMRALGRLTVGLDFLSSAESFASGDTARGSLQAVSGLGSAAGMWATSSTLGPLGWGAAALATITLVGMDYHDANKIADIDYSFGRE